MTHIRLNSLALGVLACALALAGPVTAQPKPVSGPVPAVASSLKPPVATDGEIRFGPDKTILSVILATKIPFKLAVMTKPDRVIVDLPEVNFQLSPDFGRKPSGLIRSARFGLFAPGRSRIVIELAGPASPKAVVSEVLGGAAFKLDLTLEPISAEAFQRAVQASAPLEEAKKADLPVIPQGDSRPVIVLDPGHGGIDNGATGFGQSLEKDVVLGFARDLKAKLEETGKYRVVMTRDRDVFVSLGDRVKLAQKLGAALLISIHADTLSAAPSVRGFTVYTGSEKASDAEAARLAEAENLSDQIAGVDNEEESDEIAGILGDLTLRETRSYSHLFARTLVGQMSGGTKANKNPHRSARFRVLRAPDVPSVLLELGYLSSKADAEMMKDPVWRDQTASTIVASVNNFMGPRMAVGSTPPKP
jgi:N-acetylmuramoyl-L-alanine amidase